MTTWTWLRGGARALRISTLLLMALSRPTPAQLISIKTVPIAQGDQFAIFPSNNFGMGGVSIALADTLLDPFVNPAKGARDRKSTRLNSSHLVISYAVFCLKKKKKQPTSIIFD